MKIFCKAHCPSQNKTDILCDNGTLFALLGLDLMGNKGVIGYRINTKNKI